MKILWLCSWYPNSKDPFDGDFIERHAQALALYEQVDIIHFVQNANFLKGEAYRKEERRNKNTNTFIYFVPLPLTGFKLLDAALFNRRYYNTLFKTLNEYIKTNGKPDLVHVHVPVKMGAGASWLRRKFQIPFVVTEHSSAYFETIPENYFTRSFNYKRATKRTFEGAEIVSSVSGWLVKRLQELFSIRQVAVIPNAVDTSLFFPVEKKEKQKRFIHVSMMYPLKNVTGILAALAKLKTVNDNWQMVFVGPANEKLIQQASDLHLENHVIWRGALPYNEVAREMQQADALIHFSNYENLPCVINEALCCGIPVISSNVGGIAELVNETNGILIENENTEQLKNALLSFLKNPEQFSQENISKEAAQLFSYATTGRQLLDLYKQALKKD